MAEYKDVILDKNGNAIQGCIVRIYKHGDDTALQEVTTDASGQFVFSGLFTGKYDIRVYYNGVEKSFIDNIDVVDADEVSSAASIVLQPVQDISGLKAIDIAGVIDKAQVLVEDEGAIYRYDSQSSLAEDLPYVVIPDSNPVTGRWIRIGNATYHSDLIDDEPEKHRLINDNGVSSTELWSSQKISNELSSLGGDMSKSVYDVNDNGIVDKAESVDDGAGNVKTAGEIAGHIDDLNNPHQVTKEQVGLGNVTNDAQLKRADNDFISFPEKNVNVLFDDKFLVEEADGSKKYVKFGYMGNQIQPYIANVDITKFKALRVVGSSGSLPLLDYASADSYDTAKVVGVSIENVVSGNKSFIISYGQLIGVDTSAWIPGTKLYLGLNGDIVDTQNENFSVYLGSVLVQDAVNGVVGIKIGEVQAEANILLTKGWISSGFGAFGYVIDEANSRIVSAHQGSSADNLGGVYNNLRVPYDFKGIRKIVIETKYEVGTPDSFVFYMYVNGSVDANINGVSVMPSAIDTYEVFEFIPATVLQPDDNVMFYVESQVDSGIIAEVSYIDLKYIRR